MSAAVVPDLTAEAVPVSQLGTVHLIGAGGAGMSAIARLLLARGVQVSGSDARGGPVLDALGDLGARVFAGHRAEQVPPTGTAVVSSAVRADNPELVAARAMGLRIMHRSEALATLMLGRRTVAVAGTHGKTTTTGMITVLLRETGLDPSFAIGGQLTDDGLGAAEGSTDIFVAEADESDGSFMLYRPRVAVITNIEADHLDHYLTAEAVHAAFATFCERIVDGGLLVACGDDPQVRAMLTAIGPGLAARGVGVQLYGAGPGNDVTLSALDDTADGIRFELSARGQLVHGELADDPLTRHPALPGSHRQVPVGQVALRMPGVHNALNAAAAWIVAVRFGVEPARAAAALAHFGGTRRRFETRGSAGGVRIIDDYAHHPTEVAAVLAAARTAAGPGRVIAIFQPHLFSRTRIFAADFGTALAAADEVIVLDVYAAREDPEPGVTGALVADAVPRPSGHVHFVPDAAQVPALVASIAERGDLVLTIGAGDVTALGPAILTALAADSGPGPR